MVEVGIGYKNSRVAFGWITAAFAVLPALAGGFGYVVAGLTGGLLAGGLVLLLSWSRLRNGVRGLANRQPQLEIFDYCVIDHRRMQEWVLWEDVEEIRVFPGVAIELCVRDGDRYVRASGSAMCSWIASLVWQRPRVVLSSLMLECSFAQLFRTVLRAARPFGIPVRRVDDWTFDDEEVLAAPMAGTRFARSNPQ